MGFDLQSGYELGTGADALQAQLKDMFARALAKQQMAQNQQRIAQEAQRIQLEAERNRQADELKRETLQSMQEDRQARQQATAQKGAEDFASTLAPGSQLTSTGLSRLAPGGMTGPEFVQHKDATMGSTNLSGVASATGAAPRILGLAKSANPGQAASDTFLGTAAQKSAEQQRQDKLAQAEAARQDKIDAANRAKSDKEDLVRLTASLRPAPQTPLVMMQTVDENGNPVTRFVKKEEGASYAKPANATTATRVASAETVNEVGNDLIRKLSDPKYAAALGPAMGRASSLRDFIGNPPPEYSELAGQIESYALANMGVHGMRSTQGAQQITKLLDQRHTPESLAATIRGLNDFSTRFVQNNKPKAPGGANKKGGGAADPLGIR